jgi:predicted NAD/FAD-binding protein
MRDRRRYVDKVVQLVDDVRLSTAVVSLKRQRRSVDGEGKKRLQIQLTDANGNQEWFDRVIVAIHGDEALRMLSDPTEAELECLRRVRFTPNRAILHADERVREYFHSN